MAYKTKGEGSNEEVIALSNYPNIIGWQTNNNLCLRQKLIKNLSRQGFTKRI